MTAKDNLIYKTWKQSIGGNEVKGLYQTESHSLHVMQLIRI